MLDTQNPFTPTFGEVPVQLAGRDAIVDRYTKAFKSEKRRPEFTTIFSGVQGSGKTTMLQVLANRAAEAGWIVANVSCAPGMLEDIEIQTRKALLQRMEATNSAPGGQSSRGSSADSAPTNWRSRMEQLLESLEERAPGAGLLITVDGIDPDLPEMAQLVSVYQHFVREKRRVALLMAGSPSNITQFTSDKSRLYLRRADLVELGRVDEEEIEAALRRTITDAGRRVSFSTLKQVAKLIDGYPFMLQIVGFHAWEEHPINPEISVLDFFNAFKLAREDVKNRLFNATYRELSGSDIAFLEAMLQDEGDSTIAKITERLGWATSQVAQYRKRLLEAGIIGVRKRGVVGFDMPFFREFLLERTSE